MVGRFVVALVMALAVLSATPVAHADRKDDRARELYKRGDKLYSEGRYEDSIKAFEKAYEMSGRPLLLYNIANAQERAGHWQDAVESLREFRKYAPDRELQTIDARIANLESRLERQRLEEERRRQEAGLPAKPKKERSKVGIALVSSGAAVFATGIIMAGLAKGQRNKIDDNCANVNGSMICQAGASGAFDKDKRFSILADVSFGIGAALAGVGTYFMVRNAKKRREREKAAVRVNGHVGLRSIGATVGGSF